MRQIRNGFLQLIGLTLGLVFLVGSMACDGKKSPTEPGVDTPWAVRVRVLDLTTQRPLKGATVSFIGTSGDGVSLPTDEDGLTQAVTIYQRNAPQQITVHVETSGISPRPSSYSTFTGAVGFTESFDPRENKSVWIGNVYLTQVVQ